MFTNNLLAGGIPVNPPGSINNSAFGQGTLAGLLAIPDAAAFFVVFLPRAITLCLIIAVVIFLFMLIVGAIQWISSGGDKQGLESARGKISNALIGIVILFSVYAVLSLIEVFFGIKIMALDIGSLVIQ